MTGLVRHLRRLGEFLTTDFRKMLLISAAVLVLAAAAGWVAALLYPAQVQVVLERFMDAVDQSGLVDQETGSISALGLMTNNWRAFLVTVLYGFLPFFPLSVLSLAANGLLLGLLGGWYQAGGLPMAAYLAGILPHGVLELGALVLAAACGLTLCRGMSRWVVVDPRRQPLLPLLEDLLRVLLLMIFPMTAAAALIEAYITPVVMSWFL